MNDRARANCRAASLARSYLAAEQRLRPYVALSADVAAKSDSIVEGDAGRCALSDSCERSMDSREHTTPSPGCFIDQVGPSRVYERERSADVRLRTERAMYTIAMFRRNRFGNRIEASAGKRRIAPRLAASWPRLDAPWPYIFYARFLDGERGRPESALRIALRGLQPPIPTSTSSSRAAPSAPRETW